MPQAKRIEDTKIALKFRRKDRTAAQRRYREENETRADRIMKLIGYPSARGDCEHAVIDLMANIRHWCDAEHAQFFELDRIAHMHYTAEVVQARTGEEQ